MGIQSGEGKGWDIQSGEGKGWDIQSGEGRARFIVGIFVSDRDFFRSTTRVMNQPHHFPSLSLPLLPGDDAAPKFAINSVTGLIQTTSNPLDRETRDAYTLTVIATDSGTPRNTVSCALAVILCSGGLCYM